MEDMREDILKQDLCVCLCVCFSVEGLEAQQ